MTNWQFYLVIAIPSLLVLLGIFLDRIWWTETNARITGVVSRVSHVETITLQIHGDMEQFNRDRIRNGRA